MSHHGKGWRPPPINDGIARKLGDMHAIAVVNKAVDAALAGKLVIPKGKKRNPLLKQMETLLARRPWMCELADLRFQLSGVDWKKAYKRQSDLIMSENEQVAQNALVQYFRLTAPNQIQKHQIDSRHIHALLSANADGPVVEARVIDERE